MSDETRCNACGAVITESVDGPEVPVVVCRACGAPANGEPPEVSEPEIMELGADDLEEEEPETYSLAIDPDEFETLEPESHGAIGVVDAETSDLGAPKPSELSGKKRKKRKRRKSKKRERYSAWEELKTGYLGAMPLPIVASLGCHAILLLCVLLNIVGSFLTGDALGQFTQMARLFWILWLAYDIYSGMVRGRIFSFLLSGFGLFYAYFMFFYMIPLIAKQPGVAETPGLVTGMFIIMGTQTFCWAVNLVALCTGGAGEHCQE